MHGAERVQGSVALVAGELHRGVELVCGSVGESSEATFISVKTMTLF